MKIDDFKRRLEDKCQSLNFPKPEIVRQGFSFIRVEIRLKPELNIEVYFNEETQSLTSALIQPVINKRLSKDIVLDVGEGDRIVGIEILDASKRLNLERLLPVKYEIPVKTA